MMYSDICDNLDFLDINYFELNTKIAYIYIYIIVMIFANYSFKIG
jgi:hypothetical protein